MPKQFDSLEFVARLKRKDRDAFETLVKAYTRHLYLACLGMGFSAPEAEDIVQSTWTTFFDAVVTFEGRSKVRTYLFGILYNKASEHRKKNNRQEPSLDIEEIVDRHFDSQGRWVDGPKDPEKFLAAAETRQMISDCMSRLPFSQKTAFHLREVEGEDSGEICKILGITTTNLGVLLYRARNQLRECIEKKAR